MEATQLDRCPSRSFLPVITTRNAIPRTLSKRSSAAITFLIVSLLCTGCTPHLHKSVGCMDEPLRNYIHNEQAVP